MCVCVCVCVSNCKIKSTLLRHLFIFHLFNVVNQHIILISHMRKLRSFEVKQLTWEVTLNIKMRILDQVILLLGILVNTVAPLPTSFTDALSKKEGSGKLLCLGGEGRGGIQLPWPGLAFPPSPLCGKVTGFKGLGKSVLSSHLSISGFLAHSNSERDWSAVKVA